MEPITFGAILKDWLSKDHKQEMFAIILGLILDILITLYEGQGTIELTFLFIIQAIILIFSIALLEYWIFKKLKIKNEIKMRYLLINQLTPPELEILNEYIKRNISSLTLSIMDGLVTGLELKGFIYRATTMSQSPPFFDYNIQPWARDYLIKRK